MCVRETNKKTNAMLPPVEKTPVVLLRWTRKALASEADEQERVDIVPLVKKHLEANGIIVLPNVPDKSKASANTSEDVLLLTASQYQLEKQAEKSQLIKPRRIKSPIQKITTSKRLLYDVDDDEHEIIMDHFQIRNKQEFCFHPHGGGMGDSDGDRISNRDSDGLFTVHERNHLVWGILTRISVMDDPYLHDLLLLQGRAGGRMSMLNNLGKSFYKKSKTIAEDAGLIYLLQSKKWIDLVSPLHIEEQKIQIQKQTWYPLLQMMPPIHQIQDYYGPSVAYYFAWMGYLGLWLRFLGVFGLSAYIFRQYRGDTIDTDEYTPFYGVLCFLWSILFVKFWDRYEQTLAYQWGTLPLTNVIDNSLESQEDLYSVYDSGKGHRRPEFIGYHRISPITGLVESAYFPPLRRKLQYLVSAIVTIAMLSLAFFVMILSLNMQGYIHPPRHKNYHPFHFSYLASLAEPGHIFDAESYWKCYIPVVLHSGCIYTLNTIYRIIAKKLTDWENHRTQDIYDNSLILKRFLFEAFDCYIVLFYLAFYECDVDILRRELVAVFNIDSFRRLATEILIPTILQWQAEQRDGGDDVSTDNFHPHDLHLDEYEQFDDYMEILIQFGYATLFASAYPMASLALCAAVWLEIRSDMYKLTHLCQKPVAERVPDIGMWKRLLHSLVWMSCLTNCLLFGFTSDQMMQYVPEMYFRDDKGFTHLVNDKGWMAIFIIFFCERLLIYFGLLVHVSVPSTSEDLKIQMKRRQYILISLFKKSIKEKKK